MKEKAQADFRGISGYENHPHSYGQKGV